jgi:predicted permease
VSAPGNLGGMAARTRAALRRLAGLGRRAADDAAMDEEMRFHLDNLADRLEREGASPAQARRRARLQFGGVAQHQEAGREALRARSLERLLQDLRYGARTLARTPVLTAAAVGTLALGIAATTSLFSILDRLLFSTLPVPAPGQLYTIIRARPGGTSESVPYPLFRALAAETSGLPRLAGYAFRVAALPGEADSAVAQLTSADWFETVSVRLRAGRSWAPVAPGAAAQPVAVVSDRFARRRFGSRAAALAATVALDGHPYTVIGVTPAGFRGISLDYPVDVWLPIELEPQLDGSSQLEDAGLNWVRVITRLAPPRRRETAQAAAELVLTRQRAAGLSASDSTEHLSLASASRPDAHDRGQVARTAYLVTALAALVLLIACVNIANLQIARGATRHRELAIRLALGAGRRRLVRQLMTESLLLALAGGAAGLMLAAAAGSLVAGFVPGGLVPDARDLVNVHVLVFTALVSLLVAIAFGLAPALRSTRLELVQALKEVPLAGRAAGAPGARRRLLVAQLAVSIVLLVSAGMVVYTLRAAESLNLGFDPRGLVQVVVDWRSSPEAQSRSGSEAIAAALRTAPGVVETSVSAPAAYGRPTVSTGAWHVAGDLSPQPHSIEMMSVSPGFFRTMRIPVLRGRTFLRTDDAGAPRVVVLNQSAARLFFPGRNPLGERFEFMGRGNVVEVVGVVGDTRLHSVVAPRPPLAYIPFGQDLGGPAPTLRSIEVRVASGALPAEELAHAVASVDRRLHARAQPVQELISESLALERLSAWSTGAFGLAGLLLAVLGTYGLHSYYVTRRAQELGVRLALGASVAQVRWLVWRQGMHPVVTGAALGLALAFGCVHLVRGKVFGLATIDVRVAAATTLMMLAVAGLACYLPARRASKLSPAVTLRAE